MVALSEFLSKKIVDVSDFLCLDTSTKLSTDMFQYF